MFSDNLEQNDLFPGKMRDKRILYVIGSLAVGGAERHVVQIAIQLKKRGWQTEIFVLSPGGPLTSVLANAGVSVHSAKQPLWISRFFSNERLKARLSLLITTMVLVKTLWGRRPTVVHFFLPAAYIIGGIASFFARVPNRIMSRRSLNDYQLTHSLFAKIERYLHPKMTLVCGNSMAVTKQLQHEGVSEQQLCLIYNGIDFTPYNEAFDKKSVRTKYGLTNETLVFVIVANLIPYKGHIDLINALSTINDSLHQPWVLLCLGRDDGIGSKLSSEAKMLGLENNIQLLGSRSDVPAILRIADVGILCSHQEGFSNAVLEGMAASLPMVVTDVGGNAEAVINNVTGYVVPAHKPILLGQALMKVVNNKNRGLMGAKGRERVEQCFSMTACVDAYEKMYTSLEP